MHEKPDDQIQAHRPLDTRTPHTPFPSTIEKPHLVLLTSRQLLFVAGTFLTLVALFAVEVGLQFNDARLLWTHPAGQKMFAIGIGGFLVGIPLFLGCCIVVNLVLPPKEERFRYARAILSCFLVALFLVIFCFPLIVVIVVGPSSIQIMDNLRP
jgi:hypothetical protein